MGQVALGIRSLLIKATIFFVMCALLVWALGGQLFPAPEIVDREPVEFAGRTYFWRLYAGGDEPNALHWELMVQDDGKPEAFNAMRWVDAEELMVADDVLIYAGQTSDEVWLIGGIDRTGFHNAFPVDSRLRLELLLERIRAGGELPDASEELSGEPTALDPPAGTADETEAPDEAAGGE